MPCIGTKKRDQTRSDRSADAGDREADQRNSAVIHDRAINEDQLGRRARAPFPVVVAVTAAVSMRRGSGDGAKHRRGATNSNESSGFGVALEAPIDYRTGVPASSARNPFERSQH